MIFIWPAITVVGRLKDYEVVVEIFPREFHSRMGADTERLHPILKRLPPPIRESHLTLRSSAAIRAARVYSPADAVPSYCFLLLPHGTRKLLRENGKAGRGGGDRKVCYLTKAP